MSRLSSDVSGTAESLLAIDDNHLVVLFDGVCHFCDRSVQFIADRDPHGVFKFASLQSDAAALLRTQYAIPDDLDSICLIHAGRLYTHSSAVLRIARHLGSLWPLLTIFLLLPRVIRDAVYCFVARHRYRLWGKRETCRLPTAEDAGRFLVDPPPDVLRARVENKWMTAVRQREASWVRKLLPKSTRTQIEQYRNGIRVPHPLAALLYVVDVVRAVLFQFEKWRVGQRASGVAFFIIIGFVPTVMMLVVATEMVGLTNAIGEFVVDAIITNYIPLERAKALETINEWVNNARTTVAGGIGLIVTSMAALNVFGGVYSLVNDLWQVPVRGRLAHKLGAAFLALLLVPTALGMSTWLTAQVGGIQVIGPLASRLISFALIFTIAFIGLRITARAKVEPKTAAIAAAVGAFAFEVGKTIFAIYIREMVQGSWFAIYGAIFLFPVFMLWNYITAMIVAATASLAWVLQNPGEAFYDAGIASPLAATFAEESSTRTRGRSLIDGVFRNIVDNVDPRIDQSDRETDSRPQARTSASTPPTASTQPRSPSLGTLPDTRNDAPE